MAAHQGAIFCLSWEKQKTFERRWEDLANQHMRVDHYLRIWELPQRCNLNAFHNCLLLQITDRKKHEDLLTVSNLHIFDRIRILGSK